MRGGYDRQSGFLFLSRIVQDPLPGRISPAYTCTCTRTCTRTRTFTCAHVAASDAQAKLEQRQSGDSRRRLADGARKEANGSHVPEVDIGVEDALDPPLHLRADEDEAAGGNVVVLGTTYICGGDICRIEEAGQIVEEASGQVSGLFYV